MRICAPDMCGCCTRMTAAGWSRIQTSHRGADTFLRGWFDLLAEVAGRAERRFGGLGPFRPAELAALVGDAFLGGGDDAAVGGGRPGRAAPLRVAPCRSVDPGASKRAERGERPVRARLPDVDGYVERDGVKVAYEVHGEGSPTLLLVPAWTIVHSRFWKMQVPYLAAHHRVVTFDRPGNGRSDRPLEPAAYDVEAVSDDALRILDATGTDRAVLVSLSQGAQETLYLAAHHTDRVLGIVLIGAATMLEVDHPERAAASARFYDDPPPDPGGVESRTPSTGRSTTRTSPRSSFSESFIEPHSTKQRDDTCGWAAAGDDT